MRLEWVLRTWIRYCWSCTAFPLPNHSNFSIIRVSQELIALLFSLKSKHPCTAAVWALAAALACLAPQMKQRSALCVDCDNCNRAAGCRILYYVSAIWKENTAYHWCHSLLKCKYLERVININQSCGFYILTLSKVTNCSSLNLMWLHS